MKTFMGFVVIACLCLCGFGTCDENQVKPADKALFVHTEQAATIVQAQQQLAIAMLTMDVPKIAEAIEALQLAAQPLADVKANSAHLAKTFPAPEPVAPYTPKGSEEKRKESEEQHKAGGGGWLWTALAGVGLWISRSPLAMKIPILGPLLSVLSPDVSSRERMAQVMQLVLDEGRTKLDAAIAKLVEDKKISAETAAYLPNGDTLKEIAIKEMERRGLLALNTKLYEKNPLIPETVSAN